MATVWLDGEVVMETKLEVYRPVRCTSWWKTGQAEAAGAWVAEAFRLNA